MRTHQEIFDIVARHLLAQGRKSIDRTPRTYKAGDVCVYLAPDGCKCAIGCLIPPERYHVSLEGTGLRTRHDYEAQRRGRVYNDAYKGIERLMAAADISVEQLDLGVALQRLHDTRPVFEWLSGLREIASRYGLDTSCIDGRGTCIS